eukprot:g7103.t1
MSSFRLLPAKQLPTARLQTCFFSRCAARTFSSSSGNVHFLDAENATDLAADVARLRPQHLMLETCPVRWKNLQIDAGYRPQLDAINTLHGGLLSRDLLELRKRFVEHADEQEELQGIKLHPCDRAYRKTQNEVARALFLRPWILLSYARYAKHRLARVSREVSGTPGGNNANAEVHNQQLQPLRLPTAMASVLVARRAEHFAREIAALSPTQSETVVVCCATRDFREAVERAVLTGRGDYGGVAGRIAKIDVAKMTGSSTADQTERIRSDRVAVIDFGSQVTHLICRRIRELGAYSELISCRNVDANYILHTFQPRAVILSGGPSSVYEPDAPHLPADLWELLYKKRIPVLGICYGLQEMMYALGGTVSPGPQREFGYAELDIIGGEQASVRDGGDAGKQGQDHCTATASTAASATTACSPDETFSPSARVGAAGKKSPAFGLFAGLETGNQVWMSHGDKVTKMAEGFEVLASTSNCGFAAIADAERNFYGVQFHPEVTHTKNGKQMIKTFLQWSFCRENVLAYTHLQRDHGVDAQDGGTGVRRPFGFEKWSMHNFAEVEIAKIQELVGPTDYVLGGISGGVDSSVAGGLMHRAIGDRFCPFLIDTGLLRKDEAAEVKKRLTEHIPGLQLRCVDASAEFFEALAGVTEPEKKRKVIGKLFIDAFERAIKESGLPIERTYLLQGTLYPDVIESTSFKGPSSVIKSHHNVGGLPERLKFKGLIEPLRMLFKDEVRSLGRELGLHEDSIMRHPFPGPGLAIRIVGGEVTRERADVLREADAIFITSLKQAGVYKEVGQAFAVLLPECKSVGVMGDARTYEMTVALRAVQSSDFMTADCIMAPAPVSDPLLADVDSDEEAVVDTRNAYQKANNIPAAAPPDTRPWEELEFKEKVEKLREFAWKVQGRHHKPGCILPDDFKKMAFRECQRVVSYCLDIRYIGEADFEERAPPMRKKLQEILTELERLEQEAKDHRATLAFRPDAETGVYSVQKKDSCAVKPAASSSSSAGGAKKAAAAASGGGSGVAGEQSSPGAEIPATLGESDVSTGITATGVKQMLKGDRLLLSGVGIGDKDMASVLEVCKDSSYLRHLDLSRNEISDVGIQSLVAFLAVSSNLPNLTVVNVSHNPRLTELGRCIVTGLRLVRKKVQLIETEAEAAAAEAAAVEAAAADSAPSAETAGASMTLTREEKPSAGADSERREEIVSNTATKSDAAGGPAEKTEACVSTSGVAEASSVKNEDDPLDDLD